MNNIDTLLNAYEAVLSHQWLLEGELQWCEDYNRSVKMEKELAGLKIRSYQARQELTAEIAWVRRKLQYMADTALIDDDYQAIALEALGGSK